MTQHILGMLNFNYNSLVTNLSFRHITDGLYLKLLLGV